MYVYPGSFETEALGEGVMRVLKGEEECREYSGHPVFEGFSFDLQPVPDPLTEQQNSG